MGLREKIFGKLIKKYARKNPEKIVEYLIQHSQEVKSWIANHSQDIPGYLEEVAKWAREHPQTIEEFFSKEKEKIGGLLEEYAVEIEKIFGNQKVLNIFGKGIKAYAKNHPKEVGEFLKAIIARGEKVKDLSFILKIFAKLTEIEGYKKGFERMAKLVKAGHPLGKLWRKALTQTDPEYRAQIFYNFFVGSLIIGGNKRRQFFQEYGIWPPYTLVINPTERCNINPPCAGCYAAKYRKSSDLPLKFIDRILEEAKQIGIYFIVVSGGEPTIVFEKLSGLFKKHSDMVFHIYTNGLRFAEKDFVAKVLPLGNIIPLISIEGSKKDTDSRRGKGVYKKVMTAMDNLREAGIPFGVSVTHTSKNTKTILNDEFCDMLINKGAIVAWYFQYIPIGAEPDMSLMVSSKERLLRLITLLRWWNTKPVFVADFWNNGPWVHGCIAARRYLDIIPIPFPLREKVKNPDTKVFVKPCVFVTFGEVYPQENFSLRDVFLSSKMFREIRKKQPYSENLLRPCQIIDVPNVLREVVKESKAMPAYSTAIDILKGEESEVIDKIAENWKELSSPIWGEISDTLSTFLLSKEELKEALEFLKKQLERA